MRSEAGPAPTSTRQPGASESLLTGPLRNSRFADITREAITLWEDWMVLQNEDPASARREGSEYAKLRDELLEFEREQMPEYLRMLNQRDFE